MVEPGASAPKSRKSEPARRPCMIGEESGAERHVVSSILQVFS